MRKLANLTRSPVTSSNWRLTLLSAASAMLNPTQSRSFEVRVRESKALSGVA